MGLSEADFFAQSIILWRDRLDGFREMHCGNSEGDGAPVEPLSRSELEDLMDEHPD